MKNLLLFLQKYYYWFVFLILEIVSFVLLFQFNNYQGSVYFTSANVVSGYVYEVQSRITSYFSLRQINQELTDQNVRLSAEIAQLRQQLNAAVPVDSATISPSVKKVFSSFSTISAGVINSTLNRTSNFLTIDKGTADGIEPEMGVIGGKGLVGVVYQATQHYSLVLPVVNTRSNISCRIRGRDYFGYLRWDGADSHYAMLEDVPRHAFFKKGDLVETSGFSEMFPEGIFVGVIENIYNSSDGLSFQLKVKLATDFGRLRDVHVIQYKPNQERMILQDEVRRIREKEDRL